MRPKALRCGVFEHKYEESYYGYICSKCDDFIPYGCEPWMDIDAHDEYDAEWDGEDEYIFGYDGELIWTGDL